MGDQFHTAYWDYYFFDYVVFFGYSSGPEQFQCKLNVLIIDRSIYKMHPVIIRSHGTYIFKCATISVTFSVNKFHNILEIAKTAQKAYIYIHIYLAAPNVPTFLIYKNNVPAFSVMEKSYVGAMAGCRRGEKTGASRSRRVCGTIPHPSFHFVSPLSFFLKKGLIRLQTVFVIF